MRFVVELGVGVGGGCESKGGFKFIDVEGGCVDFGVVLGSVFSAIELGMLRRTVELLGGVEKLVSGAAETDLLILGAEVNHLVGTLIKAVILVIHLHVTLIEHVCPLVVVRLEVVGLLGAWLRAIVGKVVVCFW